LLKVSNGSAQGIALLEISLGRECVVFHRIPAGGSVWWSFDVPRDCSLKIKARFLDGSQVTGGFGYYTNGMEGLRPRILVGADGTLFYNPGNHGDQ
jgi:hypothetical protein